MEVISLERVLERFRGARVTGYHPVGVGPPFLPLPPMRSCRKL